MSLVFPEGFRYDCGSCTKCCRSQWTVHVGPQAYEEISASPLCARLTAENGEAPVFLTDDGAHARVNAGGCIFLRADRLCAVHKEIGLRAKPLGCREFPFLPVRTPEGVMVGLSFYCSAVQANHGRPVEAHAQAIEGMLTEYNYDGVGLKPIDLDDRHQISWTSYKTIESMAGEYVARPDLRAALWEFCTRVVRAARSLSDAPDGWIDDAVWTEALERSAAVERDEILSQLEKMFLIGVMGTLESINPESCKRNTEALARRTVLHSDTLGKTVDLQHFDDFRTRFDAAWSLEDFRRYFAHLIFRKFLGLKRPIVANVAAFWLTLPLLECYRDLSAFAANRLQPDVNDVRMALDAVERGYLHHAHNMEPFHARLAGALTQLLPT